MRNLFQDFRLAARTLTKSKGFTATAVGMLALGLAANTIVFSVVYPALLRSLPYPQADRLMVLHWQDNRGQNRADVTAETFFMVQQQASSFASVAVTYPLDVGVNLGGQGTPQYRKALRVSERFLHTLNTTPYLGRDFSVEEDRPGGNRAVLLSYGLWQRDFGGSVSSIGRTVRVDNQSYLVVGILPKDFHSYPDADLWLPLQLDAATADPGSDYRVLVRLNEGVSRERGEQELSMLSQQNKLPYIAAHPEIKGALVLQPLQDFLVGHAKKSLAILVAAVMFVLMIACTNLAILLLVRGLSRRHELAMRAALGSNRLRLMQIPITESLLLAALGGLFGLILAKEALHFAFLPPDLPFRGNVHIDGAVVAFTVAASFLTVLVFGLLPARKLTRVDFAEILRQAPRGISADANQSRTGSILVATQTALTLVLLAGAASLLRSFLDLRVVSPGFDSHNVVVGQVSLAGNKYGSNASATQLLEPLLTRIMSLPGVEAAATVNGLPLEGVLNLPVYPVGFPEKIEHASGYMIISHDYFSVMRVPRLAGRSFKEADKSSTAPVAIVNETLARKWWPTESATGHFVIAGEELGPQFVDRPRQIVGVVADVHESGLDRPPAPTIYVPASQIPDNISEFVNRSFLTSIIVRTKTTADISGGMSAALASGDPELALASIRPLNQVLAGSLASPKFYVSLTAAFGIVALLLTAIGMWGLLNYQVRMRTKEIGVRIAIGAKPSQIVLLFLKKGLGLVTIGIVIGSVVAYPLVRFLEKTFYTPHPSVLAVILKASFPIALIAVVASVLTSLQAASIEPTTALGPD